MSAIQNPTFDYQEHPDAMKASFASMYKKKNLELILFADKVNSPLRHNLSFYSPTFVTNE